MTDPHNDTADIAWMRSLAAEGAATPMGGGGILMAAGLIFGVTSIAHWAVASGLIDLEPRAFSLIWLVATVLFLCTLAVLVMRKSRSGGVTTAANRATRAAWSAIGWGIFAMFASIAVVSMQVGAASLVILSLAPSIIMVFYGLGWAVSAAMTRSKPLGGLAVASFIAAPLLALLAEPAGALSRLCGLPVPAHGGCPASC